MHKNAANALSLARIPAAFILLLIYEPDSDARLVASLVLALLIAASDILDGQLARRYALASKLGYILDGLGDRAFHVAVYLVFVLSGTLNALVAWILILREVLQYAVRLVDFDWYENKSSTDRIISKIYSLSVHILFLEISISILLYSPSIIDKQRPFVTYILLSLAIASYIRIFQRLKRAWGHATHG